MAKDQRPEDLLKRVRQGHIAPVYLFHGPGEFRMEKALEAIRNQLIPESVRDFNLEILYGDEIKPESIVEKARSLPFMANTRVLIVRRTEKISGEDLETCIPYLEKPSPSTCLIFVCAKPDFRKKFYSTLRSRGTAVTFEDLREGEVAPWIRKRAGEIGLKMDMKACLYLQQIVGNSPRELSGELEKLYLRYGETVGIEQVRDMVRHSRMYTIFELVDRVSTKQCRESLIVLNRFLEEEDKRVAPLRLLGMLNRQIRLIWQTKAVLDRGGRIKDVAKKLGPVQFLAKDLSRQSKQWSQEELEKGLDLLYRADGWLKSGSRPRPVLENLIISLCG
jgi:DNA polymerase-3 subunit delta